MRIELQSLTPIHTITAVKQTCANCSMRRLCLPMSLASDDMWRLEKIIGVRRRVYRGEYLSRANDAFQNLFAIRLGHFKTYQVTASGMPQITGFQMAGELLGLDAIGFDRHHCNIVALEDSEVCEIPYARLEDLLGCMPTLLHHFHRLLSKEITFEQSAMLHVGTMSAEQRLAAFLVNLASRYATRGYAANHFQLRMSREDIANYLGLSIESISRLFSKFRSHGLLKVDKREIQFLQPVKLNALADGAEQLDTIVVQ